MEAQQCVKLTGTNRSIGLIAYGPLAGHRHRVQRQAPPSRSCDNQRLAIATLCLFDLVVIARGKHPIPFRTGWSSPVARQAHNLKVAGSNPAPATGIYLAAQPSADQGQELLFLVKGFLKLVVFGGPTDLRSQRLQACGNRSTQACLSEQQPDHQP